MLKKKKKQEPETGLEPDADLAPRGKLAAIDIQQQEFRLAFRGYNEKDVDEFLDRVTEEFAQLQDEVKRLRGGGGSTGAASIADAQREADEIKRRAREEADAIMGGAAAGAAMAGPASPAEGQHIGKFIVKEREFLHGLASAIQEHAETVKRVAQEAQRAPEVPAAPAPAAPAPSSAAPSETMAVESAWSATKPAISEPEQTSPADEKVISIPPSPVDTPMDEPGEPDMPEMPGSEQPATEPADVVFAEEAESTAASGKEQSLRELFWGEE